MIEKLRQANQGRKILRDFVGESGTPVPLNEAESRASICVTCKHNYSGPWLWNMATAMAIASQMKLRKTMKIHLPEEDKLYVCDRCGCQLKLKVHVPFHHIYRHTSDEQFRKMPVWCWIRQEYEKMKARP